MIDLSTLSQMDVFPTEWKYPEQGSAFKEKVFNILQNRLQNRLSDTVPLVIADKGDDNLNALLLRSGKITNFTYNNVVVYDANIDAMNQLLYDSDPESVYIMSELLRYGAIDMDGSICGDVNEIADMIMEEIPDYDYEFGDVYIDKEDLVYAAESFSLIAQGDYEGALENSVVSDFAEGISKTMDENITPVQVLRYFSIFSDLFNMNENYYATIHLYTSKEIYQYYRYRDLVPFDVRKAIDELIDVISCPLSSDANSFIGCNIFSDDERGVTCYLLQILESDCDMQSLCDENDFNGLWKSAFLTLDERLPKLREKYGQVQTTAMAA